MLKANTRPSAKTKSMIFGQWNDYISSLSSTSMSADVRARVPFESHPWVFAAAMTTALVASQAQFMVFKETIAETNKRREKAKRHNITYRRQTGARRKAMLRHGSLPKKLYTRLLASELEEFTEHPLLDLIHNPNPYQDANQLFQMTHLWLTLRGECFWVMTKADGSPLDPTKTNDMPEVIWPLGPDVFEPIQTGGYTRRGELIAWKLHLPKHMPQADKNRTMILNLNEVIQFKFPNPYDPLRGMSRLTASALGIKTDLMARIHNSKMLENGAILKGVLSHPDPLDPKEQNEYLRKFQQSYSGPDAAGRTAMLTGGFQYQPIQMGLKDIQYLEQMGWGREEILGSMNMPKSVLGITENINYATQLGQDRNLWDKNILPLLHMEEAAIDKTLFYSEFDDIIGLFDLTGIEALRAGFIDKINSAKELTNSSLHVPPRVAFGVVGLEIPEYLADDEVLVSPTNSVPLSQVLEDLENRPEQEIPEDTGEIPENPGPDPENPREDEEEEEVPTEDDPKRGRQAQFERIQRSGIRRSREALRTCQNLLKERILKDFDSDLPIKVQNKENRHLFRAKFAPIYAEIATNLYDFVRDFVPILPIKLEDNLILETIIDSIEICLDDLFFQYEGSINVIVNSGKGKSAKRREILKEFAKWSSSGESLRISTEKFGEFSTKIRSLLFQLSGVNREE